MRGAWDDRRQPHRDGNAAHYDDGEWLQGCSLTLDTVSQAQLANRLDAIVHTMKAAYGVSTRTARNT